MLKDKGANQRLMRLVEEKVLCFGPKRKGPNLLISRFLKKEDSFVQRIYKLAKEYLALEEGDIF